MASLKDRGGTSAALCQEVAQLYAALQKYQDMVQVRNWDVHQNYTRPKLQKVASLFIRISRRVTVGRFLL